MFHLLLTIYHVTVVAFNDGSYEDACEQTWSFLVRASRLAKAHQLAIEHIHRLWQRNYVAPGAYFRSLSQDNDIVHRFQLEECSICQAQCPLRITQITPTEDDEGVLEERSITTSEQDITYPYQNLARWNEDHCMPARDYFRILGVP